MFNNLTNFSYKRNWKEAIGFYLAYLLLGIILSGIVGGLAGSGYNTFNQGFTRGVSVGPMVAVIFCLIISGLLLKEKKLFRKFGYIILALLSGILAILGGTLLGLIIPAIITTKELH